MGLSRALGTWWLRRWWRRGLEGKEGKDVKNILQQIQGLRSAIIALLLLLEFLGQQLGFGGGLLAYIRHGIAAVGWSPNEALFDPTVVGTALLTLWATWKRFQAWRVERDKAATLAGIGRALVLLLLLPALSGCALRGSMAQLRLGGEPASHPDESVVRSFVCRGQAADAVRYLALPEFAWVGQAGRERYLADAEDRRLRGDCPCPAPACGR